MQRLWRSNSRGTLGGRETLSRFTLRLLLLALLMGITAIALLAATGYFPLDNTGAPNSSSSPLTRQRSSASNNSESTFQGLTATAPTDSGTTGGSSPQKDFLLANFTVEEIQVFDSQEMKTTVLQGLVYVAVNEAQQVQGFQNEPSLGNCNGFANDSSGLVCVGMLFPYAGGEGDLCFWMHDTPIPLEQSWISTNGTVVATFDAQPESDVTTCHPAAAVLETSPDSHVSVGDVVVANQGH